MWVASTFGRRVEMAHRVLSVRTSRCGRCHTPMEGSCMVSPFQAVLDVNIADDQLTSRPRVCWSHTRVRKTPESYSYISMSRLQGREASVVMRADQTREVGHTDTNTLTRTDPRRRRMALSKCPKPTESSSEECQQRMLFHNTTSLTFTGDRSSIAAQLPAPTRVLPKTTLTYTPQNSE